MAMACRLRADFALSAVVGGRPAGGKPMVVIIGPWRSAGAAPTYIQGPSVPSTQPDSILTLSGATVDAVASHSALRALQLINEFGSVL